MQAIPPSFYRRPVLQVAPQLLGCLLVRTIRQRTLLGRIVEVEAYREDDPASHSFIGRTRRTEVMFGEGGHLYVYFTYGMHYCANVVVGPEGDGEAVLLRGIEPLSGVEMMAFRRYGRRRVRTWGEFRDLTNGPAKICEAFGIGPKENGISLQDDTAYIARHSVLRPSSIGRSPRIGISRGKEKQWRFFIRGNAWVSRTGKRSA